MNKKENCQNSSEREQHIEVKRTVNQKSTSQKKVNQKSMSQEKANQKSMSQKKANQSGEKSVYDENRDALQERVEEKQWKKKQWYVSVPEYLESATTARLTDTLHMLYTK